MNAVFIVDQVKPWVHQSNTTLIVFMVEMVNKGGLENVMVKNSGTALVFTVKNEAEA